MPETLNTSIEDLKLYPIFKDMTSEQVQKVKEYIRPQKFKKNSVIWDESDDGRDLLLLIEGTVKITQRLTLFPSDSEEGEYDKSLIILSAKDRPIFGEIAMCTNVPRSAALTAETEVLGGLLSPESINILIKEDSAFGLLFYRNLSAILAERLVQTNKNVLKLTTAFSLALRHGA